MWACPQCAAKIGARRTEDLSEMLRWATAKGYTVAMLTLTARHSKGQRLDDLWGGLSEAWRFLGRGWGSETAAAFEKRVAKNRDAWADYRAGIRRKPRKETGELARRVGLLESLGALGYVRATEVTHGSSGWHVHFHVVLVLDTQVLPHGLEDRDDTLDAARRSIFELWRKGLLRNRLDAVEQVRETDGSTSHVGADLRIMHGAEVAEKLSKYETKATDAVAAAQESAKRLAESEKRRIEAGKFAAEATLGAWKQGREVSRTPFQILGDLSTGASANLAADERLWCEWVAGSRGRVQLVWSRGLADLARVADAEKSDEEIAAEEIGSEDLFRLPLGTWKRICFTAARFELLEAVEKGGREAGIGFLEERGLIWLPALGADMPPDTR
ncbi:hypothetical protein D1832_14885 [Dermacoccus abyssi]|uniref:Replication protein n=1 Tax=Dermacoccus abyssi TaxID=322596 RepID=A0A417YXS4_9MICO|nr:hypothetical protein D1832_14885 [Dermacoccus abyssi]